MMKLLEEKMLAEGLAVKDEPIIVESKPLPSPVHPEQIIRRTMQESLQVLAYLNKKELKKEQKLAPKQKGIPVYKSRNPVVSRTHNRLASIIKMKPKPTASLPVTSETREEQTYHNPQSVAAYSRHFDTSLCDLSKMSLRSKKKDRRNRRM